MVRPAFDEYVVSFDEDVISSWEDSERSLDKTAGLPSAVRLKYISREADWLYSGMTAEDED